MGKEIYQKKIEELFKKSPVVSFKSIERIVKNQREIKQYSKQLVRNLLIKGEINPLAKGYYTRHDEPALNIFCFEPAYLGLQDSLSIHNLWEQETIPVIITYKKVRPGLRKTKLGNILVRRIDKKYLFGVEYKKAGDFYLPYSDIEKTFIDLVYFKNNIGNEILVNLKKTINLKKLKSYLQKYPKRFREKVLRALN